MQRRVQSERIKYTFYTREKLTTDYWRYDMILSIVEPKCGNDHSADKNTTLHKESLNKSIKKLLERYHEKERKWMYLDVVHYVRAEGDAVSSRKSTR